MCKWVWPSCWSHESSTTAHISLCRGQGSGLVCTRVVRYMERGYQGNSHRRGQWLHLPGLVKITTFKLRFKYQSSIFFRHFLF